ncbi:MAG: MBL fold metallo-hydrolase [Planctomycetota bacterium]|nr:MBL fold metallo-hydrolase [Planctomycetota bacterium]
MSKLQFLPLGVGDAFSAKYYSSCLALHYDNHWLLVDCPHPIRKMIAEANLSSTIPIKEDRILGVALTHLHADHASGLESFAYFSFFALKQKLKLLAHKQIKKRLWEASLAAGMETLILDGKKNSQCFEDYFDYQELTLTESSRIGPFEIECRKTIHHIPTTAFRIRAGDRCLGYSADTSFDESLIDWLGAADMIIHETNYGIHTPYEKLAALNEETRLKMKLIHFPDDFDQETSNIEALKQGQLYDV